MGGVSILDKTYNDTTNSENVKEKSKKIYDQKRGNPSYVPKLKKYLTVVNEETGEVEGQFPLRNRNLGKGWFAMFQDPSCWIAEQRLSGEQLSVLLYLLGKMDYDNYIRVPRKSVAEKLNMKPVNVSRAMKTLKDMNIIVEAEREGINKTYRFNPYVAHKGSRNYQENVIEFNEVIEGKRKAQKKNKKRIDPETGEIFED